MMVQLTGGVGLGGVNKPNEVIAVKTALNAHFSRVRYLPILPLTPLVDEELFRAIRVLQFSFGVKAPDSLISPAGATIRELNKAPATYRLESKIIQGHLENTAANHTRRNNINDIAIKYDGSTLWAYNVRKDDFPISSNKCNKFVFDVLKEASAEAYVSIKGVKRPPLAAEWADKNTLIKNWRVLHENESRQAGDVAAYAMSGGGTDYSGHTGLIIKVGGKLTNISAHDEDVSPREGQFEIRPNGQLVYRRYIGG